MFVFIDVILSRISPFGIDPPETESESPTNQTDDFSPKERDSSADALSSLCAALPLPLARSATPILSACPLPPISSTHASGAHPRGRLSWRPQWRRSPGYCFRSALQKRSPSNLGLG